MRLNSSNLASADYDAETRALTIVFKGGGVYTYADVDESVYQGLLSSQSPGGYFATNIKGVYTWEKG